MYPISLNDLVETNLVVIIYWSKPHNSYIDDKLILVYKNALSINIQEFGSVMYLVQICNNLFQ